MIQIECLHETKFIYPDSDPDNFAPRIQGIILPRIKNRKGRRDNEYGR